MEESRESENQAISTSSSKKKAYITKRNTHYGTIGASRSKSSSSMPRNSRPPSAGDEIFLNSITSTDFFTPDTHRNRLDVSGNFYSLKRISKTEQSRQKTSSSDEEEKGIEQENRRWSRLSSSSQNSDKVMMERVSKTFLKYDNCFEKRQRFLLINCNRVLPRKLQPAEILACFKIIIFFTYNEYFVVTLYS